MSIQIDISVGELLDKITILEIKRERISDTVKLENINRELLLLTQQWQSSAYKDVGLDQEKQALKQVNEKLWDIEDEIRLKEKQKQFDDEFIQLARSVYITNDERATIKHDINTKTGSVLQEEKSYSDYN